MPYSCWNVIIVNMWNKYLFPSSFPAQICHIHVTIPYVHSIGASVGHQAKPWKDKMDYMWYFFIDFPCSTHSIKLSYILKIYVKVFSCMLMNLKSIQAWRNTLMLYFPTSEKVVWSTPIELIHRIKPKACEVHSVNRSLQTK